MIVHKFTLLLVVITLAACNGGIPSDTPPESVITAAQTAVSERSGLGVDVLRRKEVERIEWPDACLGLAQEGELCAQVITEGWRFIYEAAGGLYEVRTDRTGANVRLREYFADEENPMY